MTDLKGLSYNPDSLKYTQMVGTGGIGTGLFFLLEGNHTLGRNESRLAKLVPYDDYCKLHIISHYVAVLLGAGKGKPFEVWPIGRIGIDKEGTRLTKEIEEAGMSVDYVLPTTGADTMLSICFQYPDSTGGNITTRNSASEKVSAEDIERAYQSLIKGKGESSILLAAPEVPVETRLKLLQLGKEEGAFTAASILVSEIEAFEAGGGFPITDYLAVNIDEAKAIARIQDNNCSSQAVVEACMERLIKFNDRMKISITDGPNGSYGYDQNTLVHAPSIEVEAIATGGAGDAFFAGAISGLALGLPFLQDLPPYNEGSFVNSAMSLGNLVAACSVTSGDTIHKSLDANFLKSFALDHKVSFSNSVAKLLEGRE